MSLSRLYLDPNNFRFVDHREYRPIPDEHVFDADIQRRTTGFVLGRQQENVRDLIASIKANGWLDIDPILVHRTDAGRYLVVEGNRRVATLKYLQHRHEEGAMDLGKLGAAVFSELPVVLYRDVDERDRLVMMGAPPHLRQAPLACHQPRAGDGATTPTLSERCTGGL